MELRQVGHKIHLLCNRQIVPLSIPQVNLSCITFPSFEFNEFVMLCHLLLPNFYSLISGRYYLRADAEFCSNNELISTYDECELAASFIPHTPFYGNKSSGAWTKGCYKQCNGEAFWNTHHSGYAYGNGKPICKLG